VRNHSERKKVLHPSKSLGAGAKSPGSWRGHSELPVWTTQCMKQQLHRRLAELARVSEQRARANPPDSAPPVFEIIRHYLRSRGISLRSASLLSSACYDVFVAGSSQRKQFVCLFHQSLLRKWPLDFVWRLLGAMHHLEHCAVISSTCVSSAISRSRSPAHISPSIAASETPAASSKL
jgi:hypothetical protein